MQGGQPQQQLAVPEEEVLAQHSQKPSELQLWTHGQTPVQVLLIQGKGAQLIQQQLLLEVHNKGHKEHINQGRAHNNVNILQVIASLER